MKTLFVVMIVISLSGILLVSGCREAAPNLGAQPSADIFGYWVSTDDVYTGEYTINSGASFYIIQDGNIIHLNYVIEGTPYGWSGDITPDPSTSVNLTITVTDGAAESIYVPPNGLEISASYALTSSTTGVFTMSGNSFSVIKTAPPS